MSPYAGTSCADGGLSWAPHSDILFQTPGNRNIGRLDPATGATRLLIGREAGWVFSPKPAPARAEAVAPPATEKASGTFDAPKTASGASGRWVRVRGGRRR